MPWLVDGNNLARGGPRGAVRGAALALARRQRVSVVVVFDGAPPEGCPAVERLGQVEVLYVPHADAAIVARLAGGGKGWRVVTDDRELARRAREAGAEALPGEAFWARVRAGEGEDQGAGAPAPWERELAYFADPRNRLPGGGGAVARRRRGRPRPA